VECAAVRRAAWRKERTALYVARAAGPGKSDPCAVAQKACAACGPRAPCRGRAKAPAAAERRSHRRAPPSQRPAHPLQSSASGVLFSAPFANLGAAVLMLPPAVKLYVAPQPVSLRKGFDGLSLYTQTVLRLDPLSGHLFVFFNRTR